jgi:hypothetical protein
MMFVLEFCAVALIQEHPFQVDDFPRLSHASKARMLDARFNAFGHDFPRETLTF